MSELMNKVNIQINDQLLDELVTGNLQGTRYRQVLEALEARPDLWRKCAIAFLQEQALTQDLKALSRGDIDWSTGASTLVEPETSAEASAQSATRMSSAAPNWSFATVQRLSALAALLIVSFTIGWMGAGMRSPDAINPNAAAPLKAGLLGNSGLAGGTIKTPIAQANGNPTIANATLLDGGRFMPIDLQVPPRLRELELAGKIRIETVDAIVPVQLDDGTSAIVPIQQLRVVPVIYSY